MSVNLRKATIEDAQDILDWRNDPVTRESSFTKEEIDLETHMAWFKKKLADESCHMFILVDGDKKVGNIRVDVEDKTGEISYMIAPNSRRKGYGRKIIALVEPEVSSAVTTLVAYTLKDNPASAKCFSANGYTREDGADSIKFTKSLV